MEHGFFHPNRGYWQTNSEVPQETMATYPEGTIEVPLKPGVDYEWIDGAWVYIEPPPQPLDRSTLQLSFAQLLIGLVTEGWITKEEGRAWRDRVALPPAVNLVIASLPEEQQFAAETRALAPSEILRLDPLVEALAIAEGKTPEELDQFFITYKGV
jgi:hypothetical protein